MKDSRTPERASEISQQLELNTAAKKEDEYEYESYFVQDDDSLQDEEYLSHGRGDFSLNDQLEL